MTYSGTVRLRGRRYAALFVLLALHALGCSHLRQWARHDFKVGPEYCEPVVEAAADWIEFNDPQFINEDAGIDTVAWWHCFNDPVLVELVESAHQQNLPLRVAQLRVVEAQAEREIAVGRLFPQFQEVFGAFEQRQRSRTGFSSGLPSPTRSLGIWSKGFNASWELDLWGKYRRSIAAADATVEAWDNNYADVLLTLTADIAATYFEIRTFQQRLEFLKANLTKQEQNLALAEKRNKSGIVTMLDVTQAEASLHRTRALAPVLKRGLRQANNRLCVLLGHAPVDLLDTLGDHVIPEPPAHVVVGIPVDLVRRRPDVRRAERRVASQSERIGVAVADLFPTFTIRGSINWQSSSFSQLLDGDTNAGFINPGFNWNVLNYGRVVGNVAVQNARLQQLVSTYAQTVLVANREAEDAVADYLNSRERAEELLKSVEANLESVGLAQIHYDAGWIDFDRLNNLQVDLVSQQDEAIAAKADVLFALIRIYRAIGGGWQPTPESRGDSQFQLNEPMHPPLPEVDEVGQGML